MNLRATPAMVLPNSKTESTLPEPGEEVLRAFDEWLTKDRMFGRNTNNSRPPTAETQKYIPSQLPRPEKTDKSISNAKPRLSVTRRVFRTFVLGLLAVAVALGVIVWRSENSELRSWVPSLQGLPSTQTSTSSHSITTSQNQTVLDSSANAARQIGAPSPGLPMLQQPAEEYAAIQKKLELLTNKVDVIRSIVDQLADNQQKMEQAIAAIKNAQRNLDQRPLSAASRPAVVHPSSRKPTSDLQPSRRQRSRGQSIEPPLPLH